MNKQISSKKITAEYFFLNFTIQISCISYIEIQEHIVHCFTVVVVWGVMLFGNVQASENNPQSFKKWSIIYHLG